MSETPAIDEDQAFVLNSFFNYEEKTFGVFFTTLRLIKIIDNNVCGLLNMTTLNF